jgi:AAA+ ATPase superfamily predicted ATPase
MFFGRERELEVLLKRVGSRQSVSIVGLRRIGKTSLLYRLVEALPSTLGPDYVPAYVDAGGYSTQTLFVEYVGQHLSGEYKDPDVPGVTDMAGFTQLIERLSEQKIHPVLLLDEFEAFSRHPESFDETFYTTLRLLA